MYILIVLGCSMAICCQASNISISGMAKLFTFDNNLPLRSVCYITDLDNSSPFHCISDCLTRRDVCRGVVFNHEQKTCKLLKCNPKGTLTAEVYETGKWDLIWKTSGFCEHGWVKHLDRCYFFNERHEIWWNAKGICEGHGGSLASPRSIEEHSWIADLISKDFNESLCYSPNVLVDRHCNYWAGALGIYNVTKGTYVWISDYSTINLTNWYPGEPRNLGDACLLVHRNGMFASMVCSTDFPYICEAPTLL